MGCSPWGPEESDTTERLHPGWEDPWEKEISQPTPVFFLGKSHGERNLAGYIPWGHKAVNDNKNIEAAKISVFVSF